MADKRLIDANALKRAFEEDGHLSAYIEEYIDEAPTHEVARVVVHARWKSDVYFDQPVMRCTACACGFAEGHRAENFAYCPHCGAKMGAKDMDVHTKDDKED